MSPPGLVRYLGECSSHASRYARLNQPYLAVRRYHQCERQLRDEFGIEPAESARQLRDRIRRRESV